MAFFPLTSNESYKEGTWTCQRDPARGDVTVDEGDQRSWFPVGIGKGEGIEWESGAGGGMEKLVVTSSIWSTEYGVYGVVGFIILVRSTNVCQRCVREFLVVHRLLLMELLIVDANVYVDVNVNVDVCANPGVCYRLKYNKTVQYRLISPAI